MNGDPLGPLLFAAVCAMSLLGLVGLPALAIGLRLRRRQELDAAYAQLWSKLAGIVDGTYHGRILAGAYAGHGVEATVARAPAADGSGRASYYHQLTLRTAGQGQDWGIHDLDERGLDERRANWRVESADPTCAQLLLEAGVREILERVPGLVSAMYRADEGTLVSFVRIADALAVPEPAQFRAQLDLLLHLEQINRRIQGATAQGH